MPRLYIIIAEPSAIIRSGIVAILQSAQSISCQIAQLPDTATITSAAQKHAADILIVNPSHMGQFSPSQIKSELGNENMQLVALQSSFADQSLLQNYDAVISIYDSAESIIEKIEQMTVQSDTTESRKELSQREKEIIVCVVKGMTNKQIADTLYLSTHTVIAHRRNITNKLQIHSPSGLTIYAIVNKLVDLADIKNSIYKEA